MACTLLSSPHVVLTLLSNVVRVLSVSGGDLDHQGCVCVFIMQHAIMARTVEQACLD